MSLIEIIRGISKERRTFTDSFREYVRTQIFESEISDKTKNYLEEALIDEGMTRYYRFSVTAANELRGFGFEVEPNVTEMKMGMGLMLFWLRLVDRYIDSHETSSDVNGQVNEYLEKDGALPKAEDPLTDSIYFATNLLRNHGLQEGYILDLVGPLKKMTTAMLNEFTDLANVRVYCDAKAQTGVTLSDTLLAIMKFYVGNHNPIAFRKFENFYHGQFKAGMYLDTLADFNKDYNIGIAPEPNLKNKVYISWRMAKEIGRHFLHFPRSFEGAVRVMLYSAVSTYHILRDAPTQG